MGSSRGKLRRILLVRNDRIGDLVLTLPAFEAVRREWPDAQLTALVSPTGAPLVAGVRSLDEIIVDEPRESPLRLARRLKAMRFDAAVLFNTNTRNCLAALLARIPRRVTWIGKPIGLVTGNRQVMLRRSHPAVHEADFALAFVRRLGAAGPLSACVPRFEIDPLAQARVAERIARELGQDGPLFGVHPGNRGSAYNWPPVLYAALIARLAKFGRVMVTGNPAERGLLETIAGQVPRHLSHRVGLYTDLHLIELAAALTRQTVLTVSSTGPMHLAGIVGTPTVALFSPHPAHAPAKWAPLGANHTLLVAPLAAGEDPRVRPDRAAIVMSRIGVERVLEANLRYATLGAPLSPANTGAPRMPTEPASPGALRR